MFLTSAGAARLLNYHQPKPSNGRAPPQWLVREYNFLNINHYDTIPENKIAELLRQALVGLSYIETPFS